MGTRKQGPLYTLYIKRHDTRAMFNKLKMQIVASRRRRFMNYGRSRRAFHSVNSKYICNWRLTSELRPEGKVSPLPCAESRKGTATNSHFMSFLTHLLANPDSYEIT